MSAEPLRKPAQQATGCLANKSSRGYTHSGGGSKMLACLTGIQMIGARRNAEDLGRQDRLLLPSCARTLLTSRPPMWPALADAETL